MNGARTQTRLARAVASAWQVRWRFLITFLVVFFVSLSVLIWVDLVPDSNASPVVTLSGSPLVDGNALSPNVGDAFATGELPVRIEAPSIGLKASISNPATTDVETLDNYLLKGAVRYPTSALLGVNGNVILFGHSSYLPIVHNLAYKTFDGIQDLKPGDSITVYSSNRAYEYSVETVKKEDANADAIPLTVSGAVLTLSTCDSFGEKTDRFVVTANFVGSHALGS